MVSELAALKVTPTGAGLGADVEGINLAEPITHDFMDSLMETWHEHLVLRFRDQQLTDENFVAFGRHFGELDLPFASRSGNAPRPDLPEMAVMSNVKKDGKAIGALGNLEAAWHTDMSYIETPPTASLLYAIEVPKEGADTYFANMYTAYERLPAQLKKEIEGKQCKHDSTYNSVGEVRKGHDADVDPTVSPGTVHPIVRTHPETGKKCLFLGRRRNGYIMGMPLDESEALLDKLWGYATQDDLTWCQKWKVGDLIIWDNRCTMHYREAFDNNLRRILHRLQVVGTKPC